MSIALSKILKELPKEDSLNYRGLNFELFKKLNKTCIVIDDDPTGNQTVYGIPLLTNWDVQTLTSELENSSTFFLLTNSRSLSAEESKLTYKTIGANILEASKISGKAYTIISRSDSTLRGHFPLEPETLKSKLNLSDAIIVFIPVMFEGNRVTVNNTHYINEEGELTPVSETPFAQDHSFKYSKSNLKEYIEEKSKGDINSSEVYSFSLSTIRTEKVEALSNTIFEIPPSNYCVFDSLSYSDLDKVSQALLLAEKSGKKIIYRTSSSFVPSYIGLKPMGLIDTGRLLSNKTSHGGLTVVGSYVKKSSEQLQKALRLFDSNTIIELDIRKVLGNSSAAYLSSLIKKIDENIKAGENSIVFTSRTLITGKDASATINIASTVSNALVEIVNGLSTEPKYLIAKGGITSHDLATKGLEMKRSKVIGQIAPGIPVWEMGEDTKFPKLPYIVFPGNVGNENTLKNIIKKLN